MDHADKVFVAVIVRIVPMVEAIDCCQGTTPFAFGHVLVRVPHIKGIVPVIDRSVDEERMDVETLNRQKNPGQQKSKIKSAGVMVINRSAAVHWGGDDHGMKPAHQCGWLLERDGVVGCG